MGGSPREFGVSSAVCLAPVSQTAGMGCKSSPCPPLCQRQLQPWGWGLRQLQQLCTPRLSLLVGEVGAGGRPAVPEASLKRVHMCLGVRACGQGGGFRGKTELASFLEQKLWFVGRGGRDGRLTGPWGGTLHFLRSSCKFLLSLPQETGGSGRKRDSLMPSWPCTHWSCCVLSLSMPQGPGRYRCSRKDPRLRGLGLKGLLLSPLNPFLVLFVRTQQLPRSPSVSLPLPFLPLSFHLSQLGSVCSPLPGLCPPKRFAGWFLRRSQRVLRCAGPGTQTGLLGPRCSLGLVTLCLY